MLLTALIAKKPVPVKKLPEGFLPFTKMILVMKFTIVFLLIACLNVQARGYAQSISLQEKNASLQKVFKEIKKQTGYAFLYTDEVLEKAGRVDIAVQNASLEETLDICFKNQPLTYNIVNRTVIVKKKETAVIAVNMPLPPIEVRGTIMDENGKPLPGVSVTVQGTGKGTQTNERGEFTIQVPNSRSVLEISMVGYEAQTKTVGRETSFTITLLPKDQSMNQVVVVGYGTQRRSDLTGSIASVSQKDLTQGVNNNALQALNGKAAGVQISQSSSAPGGDVSIRVRGAGSINSSNAVLVVVDGLPGVDPSSISQEDIESIQVLKDASAAAIYGSRAANGVILITTKKGKTGKVNISLNTYVGVQEAAKLIDVLNAKQYMQVMNDLAKAQNQAPVYTQQQIDTIKGTNWQDAIYHKALAQNYQLSVSGGSEYNKYYVGLNYLNQDGILKNTNLKKANARLNYDITTSDKFNMTVAANIDRTNSNQPYNQTGFNENAGAINTALYFDPTISTALDANGRYQFNPLISLENPLAIVNGITQQQIKDDYYGTVIANYTPVRDLKLTVRLGGNVTNFRSDYYNSRITQLGFSAGGIGSIYTEQDTHWLMEYLAQYNKHINSHNFSLLLGTTSERFDTRSEGASAQNFLSDVTLTNLLGSGAQTTYGINSSRSSNKLNSYLGRFNYNYEDKYLLTASFRADGTSRFSDKNKYALFPSAAIGWNISKGPFMNNVKKVSTLKLRLGYGKIGNQAIGNYATLQTYIAGGSAVLGNNLYQGAEPARLPNPDLKWETTEEYNLGLDYGFFDNRISGSVEYYIKSTYDQLFSKPVPAFTGFSSQLVNFGSVRNSGFDISLTSQNIRKKDFSWNTIATASILKNKVTQLPGFIPQVLTGAYGFIPNYALVQTGYPIYAYYGYQVAGIFQSDAQAAASGQPGAKAGYPIFKDQNGDKVIDPKDRVILGSPLPKFTWGFDNTLNYKKLSLDVLFLGVQGISTLNDAIMQSFYPVNFSRNRIAKYYLDRWTPANPNAPYPSGINPNAYGGQYAVNSYTVTDASFIRLKTVTLSYSVPLSATAIRGVTLYVAGDNLFTITPFEGYDPDANANGGSIIKVNQNDYPLARTFRLGAKVDF